MPYALRRFRSYSTKERHCFPGGAPVTRLSKANFPSNALGPKQHTTVET